MNFTKRLILSATALFIAPLFSALVAAQVNYVSWDFTPSITSANYATNTTNQTNARTSALNNTTLSTITLNGTGISGVNANTFHRSTGWPAGATPDNTKFLEYSVTLNNSQTFLNNTLSLAISAQVSNAGTAATSYQVQYGYGASPVFANATNGTVTGLTTTASSNTATIPAPGNTTSNILKIRLLGYNAQGAGTGNIQLRTIALTAASEPAQAVNLSVSPSSTSEGGSAITVTATASGAVSGDQTVNLDVTGGTAMSGDYMLGSATITIMSGQATGSTTFTAVDDILVESTETATLTISNPTAGITLGTTTSQMVSIADNDVATPPVITYNLLPSTTTPTNPTLGATVTDDVEVASVSIHYSIDGGSYITASCNSAPANLYNCPIDDSAISGNGVVYYYLTATDTAGSTAQTPSPATPSLYTVGTVVPVPAGTYTDLGLGGTTFGGDVIVLGDVNINGLVDSTPYTLQLSCQSMLIGGSQTAYITGTLRRDICSNGTYLFPIGIQAPATLNQPNAPAARLYAPLSVTVTNVVGMSSSLSVNSTDSPLPGVDPNFALNRYWTITETGDITANLLFQYNAEDVIGTESAYQLVKSEAGAISVVQPFTLDTSNHTISTTGVTEFSDWTAAQILGPTASGVSVSGIVRTTVGKAARGAQVVISDLSGFSARTSTDLMGNFRLENVVAGRYYLVEITHPRYRFASRLIFVGSDLDGLEFFPQ